MKQAPSAANEMTACAANYLERLPEWARRQGSIGRGEIQLLDGADSSRVTEYGIVYEDKYIAVVRDLVRFRSGAEGTYLRIFEQPTLKGSLAGVVILPVYQQKFWLVRHYRHATRNWELELPRGFCEPSLSLEENVRRETKEELGVEVAAVRHLGQVAPNTGLLASLVDIWRVELASGPVSTDEGREEGIATPPVAMTAEELREAIRSGIIRDAFTLSAVALASATGLSA